MIFVNIDQIIPKCIWRGNRNRISETILKKNKAGGISLPGFKMICKAEDEQSRTENSEIDPDKSALSNLDMDAKVT